MPLNYCLWLQINFLTLFSFVSLNTISILKQTKLWFSYQAFVTAVFSSGMHSFQTAAHILPCPSIIYQILQSLNQKTIYGRIDKKLVNVVYSRESEWEDRVNERLTSNFIPFLKLNFWFLEIVGDTKGDSFCSCGMEVLWALLRKK